MKTMKKSVLLILFAGLLHMGMKAQEKDYQEKFDKMTERTQWFREARFGMFIHWGPYAVLSDGEWVKHFRKMTNEDYQKYVDAFVPSNYHPEEWAKLAKEAGMKYAVMTAKHHDGFCMFDSKHTNYKITNNVPGQDYIKQYVEAFRAQGLKVGLYYSLIDWHHKDYPNVGNHPQLNDKEYSKRTFNWDNYLKYMHAQIEELMTNYGKIDVLWLDYSFNDYQGEKWKAKELVAMIRKHQPDIVINNRLVFSEGVVSGARKFSGYGDFETPEQAIPDAGLVDIYGNNIPWETCLTLNNSWGYSSIDDEWKSPELIIRSLVNCVSKNGNLLLNVGPDAQGTIPLQSRNILKEVGQWMQVNGESIYSCYADSLPQPEWGYFTRNGNILYAHVTYQPIGHINFKPLAGKVKNITVLNTGKPAASSERWFGDNTGGNFFVNIEAPTYNTYTLPDNINTVFKITLLE